MTHSAPKDASVQPVRTKRKASPFTLCADGGKEKRTSTNAKRAWSSGFRGNLHAENTCTDAASAKSGGMTKKHKDAAKTAFRRNFIDMSISVYYENP